MQPLHFLKHANSFSYFLEKTCLSQLDRSRLRRRIYSIIEKWMYVFNIQTTPRQKKI